MTTKVQGGCIIAYVLMYIQVLAKITPILFNPTAVKARSLVRTSGEGTTPKAIKHFLWSFISGW